MSNAGHSRDAKTRPLDSVLAEYRRRIDHGENVDCDAMIRQFPHLADGLRAFFKSIDNPDRPAASKTSDETLSNLETLPPDARQNAAAEVRESPPNVAMPKRFGRYEIVKRLGRGAMGTVYLARDTQLDRNVALKIPTASGGDSDEVLKRFYREAKAAATLDHPNICAVYEVDKFEGQHYIAMKFIEGKPLSNYVGPGRPMDERKATLIVRKLAQALSHAHKRGIIHRDLKPANVMVGEKNEPMLTDFGLARQVNNVESVRMTQSGALLGTPAYMSPEQVDGNIHAVGAASDIYSLGVIFYELLTGRLPFSGSVAAVLAQIVSKEPDKPSQSRPDLDRRLESICLRMMSKPVGKRFASMDEVADALADVLKTPAERKASDADVVTRQAKRVTVLTAGDAQGLARTARKCFEARDYEQAARILEQIPERFRDPEMDELLEEAASRSDEVNYLVAAVQDADAREDYKGLLPTVERLLELKPGHRAAFAIYKKLTSQRGLARSRSRGRSQFPPYAKWIAAAALTGVFVFVITSLALNRNASEPARSKDSVQQSGAIPSVDSQKQADKNSTPNTKENDAAKVAASSANSKNGDVQRVPVPNDAPAKSAAPSPVAKLAATAPTPPAEGSDDAASDALMTADVTIKSVDVARRTVTISRKSKNTVFDVSRKADIIVNGKAVAIEALQPEQNASITFDPEHDIIARIDVAIPASESSPSPAPSKPVTVPELVALHEIDTPEAELSPWVSDDGLTIYWSAPVAGRSETQGRKLWIWSAHREAPNQLFKNAQPLIQGIGPTLTSDQLELILMQPRSDGGTGQTLYVTSRQTMEMPFERPHEIAELPSDRELWCPYLSSDGLTLYFVRFETARKQTTILTTRRENRAGKWNTPQPIQISLPHEPAGFFMWPSISNDDRTLLCSIQTSATDLPRFVALSRQNDHSAFTKMTYVEVPGINEFHGFRLRYVAATDESFFFSTRGNEADNWDLWMIKNFAPMVDEK